MRFPKSACIETLYLELPFYDRLAKAKRDGFDYVEFWGWRDKDLDQLKAAADSAGIGISGFNGNQDYSLLDPVQKRGYFQQLRESVAMAKRLGALAVTIHSNALGAGGLAVCDYRDLSDAVKLCTMYEGLKECAKIAGDSGIRVNLEPLNTTCDHAGYYLTSTRTAAELTRMVASPLVKVLYDVYHMQQMEGRLCDTIRENIDQIGHVHVADVPGRHEPGTGEIRYERVFEQLEECGYQGIVCYELFPQTTTQEAVLAIMRG